MNNIKKACIFGAGRMGILASKILKDFEQLFFCDNDKNKVGTIINGLKVIGFNDLKKIYCEDDNIDVYIAGYVQEIYEQCKENGIDIAGIYHPKKNEVVSYLNYCVENQNFYCNDAYILYKNAKQAKIHDNIEKFLTGEQMSDCIIEVAIELSNLCNYASIHTKCPASQINEKKIMPLSDIENIVRQLLDINFKGTICFHIYNEPLMDPRLFFIIDYIKQRISDVKVLIYTNGYYLTDSLVKDLQNGFADIITATGYGQKEYNRLINLRIDIPYYVLRGELDDRLSWGKENTYECNVPCASLFSQVPIWVNGDVGLCCVDCYQKAVLGNIKNSSLEEILDSPKIRETMKSLLSGKRKDVNYCKYCFWEGIRILK